MQSVTLLGATGSIGTQTLAVIAAHQTTFKVTALAAGTNHELLFAQCVAFQPTYVAMDNRQAAAALAEHLADGKLDTQLVQTDHAIVDLVYAANSDIVVCAISGSIGVHSFYAALKTGKRVLLANKEALVMAGSFFYHWLRDFAASVLPIDSEHYAIMQSLPTVDCSRYPLVTEEMGVASIILTASGGAFLHHSSTDLEQVELYQACQHPNWSMGKKITIDSATLMNKALELIEAYWLFGVPLEALNVYIHPTSVIHGMVVYNTGSIVSQMSEPDMRIPIAGALGYPHMLNKVPTDGNNWSLRQLQKTLTLKLSPLDETQFSAIRLSRDALKCSNTAPVALNAANEIAVGACLARRIRFADIMPVVLEMMNRLEKPSVSSVDAIFAYDKMARHKTQELIARCY